MDTGKSRIEEFFSKEKQKQGVPGPHKTSLDDISKHQAEDGAVLAAKMMCGDMSVADELLKSVSSISLTKQQETEFKLSSMVCKTVSMNPAKQIAEGLGLTWSKELEAVVKAGIMGGASEMLWTLKDSGGLNAKLAAIITPAKKQEGGSSGLWKS